MGEAERRQLALKMLKNTKHSLPNAIEHAKKISDDICDIIQYPTEYNMVPFLSKVSQQDIINKIESIYSSGNKQLNTMEILQIVGQEFSNKLPNSNLEYDAISNMGSFWSVAEFQSKEAIKEHKKFRNQYNPNNSLTYIAVILKKT